MKTSFRSLFIFFKKRTPEVRASGLQLSFNLLYNENKPYKTLHYRSRDMVNFDFLEKVLGIVFPLHFPQFLKK